MVIVEIDVPAMSSMLEVEVEEAGGLSVRLLIGGSDVDKATVLSMGLSTPAVAVAKGLIVAGSERIAHICATALMVSSSMSVGCNAAIGNISLS